MKSQKTRKSPVIARKITLAVGATILCASSHSVAFAATGSEQVPETRALFLVTVLQALDIAPAPTGASPYSDVSTDSPSWGYIHAAVQNGLVKPVSHSYFGAAALVNEDWAMQFAANDLHVKQNGPWTLAALANTTGLFVHYQANSTVSAADVSSFATTLASYAKGKLTLPAKPGTAIGATGTGAPSSAGNALGSPSGSDGSSTSTTTASTTPASGSTASSTQAADLTRAQATLFTLAQENTSQQPYQQAVKRSRMTLLFSLTNIGKLNTLFATQIKSQDRTLTTTLKLAYQDVKGHEIDFLTTQVPAASSPTGVAQDSQVWVVGNKTYYKTGSSWKLLSNPSPMMAQASATVRELSTLSDYKTITASTKDSVTWFHTTLNAAKTPVIFSQFLYDAFANTPLTATQKATLLANTELDMDFEVAPVKGKPLLVAETQSLIMQIPASIIFASAPPTSKVMLLNSVAGLTFTLTSQISNSFLPDPITLPTNLPS